MCITATLPYLTLEDVARLLLRQWRRKLAAC